MDKTQELKHFYRGVKDVLKALKREVKDRQVETQQEMLDLIEDLRDDYIGEEAYGTEV